MRTKKPKLWSSTKADTLFSKWIRERDGKCIRCQRKDGILQCSHFWSRGNSAVRYLPENCDALCYPCHYGNAQGWEYNKQGSYRDFKISQLGIKKYTELEHQAKSVVKRSDAIIHLMSWLK